MIVTYSILDGSSIDQAIEKGKQLRVARENFWCDRGLEPMPYGYVLHRLEQMQSRILAEGKNGAIISKKKG